MGWLHIVQLRLSQLDLVRQEIVSPLNRLNFFSLHLLIHTLIQSTITVPHMDFRQIFNILQLHVRSHHHKLLSFVTHISQAVLAQHPVTDCILEVEYTTLHLHTEQ